MSNEPMEPQGDGFDEEELVRSEFDSIVSGLSLDETTPSTYLDELDRMDERDRFVPPHPPSQGARTFFFSAHRAVRRWLKQSYHDGDGVEL